ncbi:MAG: class I SAM-dependent methyltransferase, partial [Rhodospirillales bacterium]
GQTVLDLCCGDGWFTLALLRLGCRVEGLDCDEALLKQAARAAENAGYTQVSWHLGDAMALDRMIPPFVDAALIANTFHGVEKPLEFCQAVRRILTPGGRFVIVNWHARPREETTVLGQPRGPRTELRLTPGQTSERVLPAGFALEQVIDLPPYHYGAIFTADN